MELLTLEDFKEKELKLSSGNYFFLKCIDAKIYANNTIYIDGKKIELSEDDLKTIETASFQWFLRNHKTNGGSVVKTWLGSYKYDDNTLNQGQPGYEERFELVLKELSINLIIKS